MKTMRAMAIGFSALVVAGRVMAGETALEPGAYEVSSRLELPHVEDMGVTKTATVCVTAGDNGAHGLVVLSENNPLGKCPATNVHQDGDTLTFDIVCPGGNAAIGWAKYTLQGQRFIGSIAMKMGGKNMTMTELQSGHRIGSCSETPRS